MKNVKLQAVRTGVPLFSLEEEIVLQTFFESRDHDVETQRCIDACLPEHGIVNEGPWTDLSAAVATILLETIEQELPNWGTHYGKHLKLTRKARSPEQLKLRKLQLQPQRLFTINWANSGPGYSWPADFWVTWVPTFDRYVVTSSFDCPDCYGYTDFALGHFAKEIPLVKGAHDILVENWCRQNQEYEQCPWEELWDEGIVDAETAWLWRAEAWPDY